MNTKPNQRLCPSKWWVSAAAAGIALASTSAFADVGFLGVASGDASSTSMTVWTRAVDSSAPAAAALTLQLSADPTFATGVTTLPGPTDPTKDYTLKLAVTGLQPATVYYYRFVGPNSVASAVGRCKTAPNPTVNAPVHFAFSGDMDGLMRPYALASTVAAQNLDFYVNLGDTIYETASTSTGNAGTSNLASAAVTSSGSIPAPSATGATQAQLFADYSRKYREQFLPVNTGGQAGLQGFYAAQSNYTLLDNHELGNKQYINGGAPAGGPVGGFASGAGVDARVSTNDVNTSGTFMNQTGGFQTLQQVYLNHQPITDRGTVAAPADPRTNGTQQLYFAQPWGRNAIFINIDDRSYRDIRVKTAANADDTGARAANPARTMLGTTQLAWLEQSLLNAQTAGTPWKFIAVSNPIDQIGPIGGALTGVVNSSGNAAYSPVAADGGKSWIGGYRAERNALLKFIADHQITNVVFLSTDDHQNRVNELTYSPTGQTEVQSSYVKVPYCFEIVCGPLGATGPDLFLNHDFTSIKTMADSFVTAQTAAGIEPCGLTGYPGLHNVVRENDPNAATSPSAVDFYSPDTFNYNLLDVSADGRTLTVSSVGINSTAQNSALEYGTNGNTARTVFSFQIDAADPLNNIDHVIVVYQENWSFDALYGSFPGANGLASASAASLNQLDRLTGAPLSTLTGTFNVATRTSPTLNAPWPQPIDTNNGNIVDTRFPTTLDTLLPYNLSSYLQPGDKTGDIVHRYWQEQFQINDGSGNKFVTWSDNPGLVMSFFDATNLPEGLLAQQYTMCDNFFHSAFGGSFLNHQFFVAAAAPVYAPWTTADLGNVAYLDATGVLVLNTSGSAAGKVVRDGNITPLAGDQLTVTLNGVPNTIVPASAVAFADGSTFDQHYAVNTIYSANLQSAGSPTAATLLPSLNDSNPADATRPYIRTIGDLLDNAGIAWKWYSGGWDRALAQSPSNPSHFGTTNTDATISLFQWHHQAFAFYDKYAPFVSLAAYNANPAAGPFNPYSAARLQDETKLYTDISNNTLPSVAFVKFLGPDNEHPGYASLQQGQQHVADLVAAVQANPALWAHTLIVVTYDEHGGRWDHVTPPVRDRWGPGVRVPTIMISPYAKRGYVDHTQYDTSAILATIEHRFGLPALNQRDAGAGSLGASLTNLPVTRGTYSLNRRLGRMTQTVTVTNLGALPVVGPVVLALDNLSANTTLANGAGTTANNAPLGSPYIVVSNATLAPGATASVALQFTVPASGTITYTARTVSGAGAP